TISQPYMVAIMSHRLEVQPDHKVLEIGTGSGYQAAVLSQLAREVCTIERLKPLLDDAFHRLSDLGIRNVKFKLGDGTAGWLVQGPRAPKRSPGRIAARLPTCYNTSPAISSMSPASGRFRRWRSTDRSSPPGRLSLSSMFRTPASASKRPLMTAPASSG